MEPKLEETEIGPERALELLKRNERNRPMDFALVKTYTRQMKTPGGWRFVGDPIRVSVTGRLLDGQNRLQAVVNSETTQKFALMTGLADDDQKYMDVGKRRSPGDVFTMFGVSNGAKTAAVTKLLMSYGMRNLLDTKYKITNAELLDYYQDPANMPLIDAGVTVGDSTARTIPISPAVVGTIHAAASRDSDPFTVNEFFEKLRLGYGMGKDDPINALRNWLLRRRREDLRVNRFDFFFVAAKSWNDWVQGIPVYRVQLPQGGLQSSEQIPWLKVGGPRQPEEVSEENPAVTPYSLTRREMDAANGGARAS